MKKSYDSPEIDIIKLSLKDVVLSSPSEGSIGENIGGNDDNPIDLDDSGLGG